MGALSIQAALLGIVRVFTPQLLGLAFDVVPSQVCFAPYRDESVGNIVEVSISIRRFK